jgi:hypothetical protein
MTETITIQVPVELDNQFFEDIVVTMLEGGSNYWVDHITINHPEGEKPKGVPVAIWAASAINKGGYITIFVQHEGDAHDLPPGNINKEILVSGVQQWINNHKIPPEAIENYDADDADAILQYARFGKLVFG